MLQMCVHFLLFFNIHNLLNRVTPNNTNNTTQIPMGRISVVELENKKLSDGASPLCREVSSPLLHFYIYTTNPLIYLQLSHLSLPPPFRNIRVAVFSSVQFSSGCWPLLIPKKSSTSYSTRCRVQVNH